MGRGWVWVGVFGGVGPVLKRTQIDRLGAEAGEALGMMGAYVTETIQGLSDLVAFQAVGRRRAGFMQAVGEYQQTRLSLLADLSSQTAQLEIATGLGGLAVAIAGAALVADPQPPPAAPPLLIPPAPAPFPPIP